MGEPQRPMRAINVTALVNRRRLRACLGRHRPNPKKRDHNHERAHEHPPVCPWAQKVAPPRTGSFTMPTEFLLLLLRLRFPKHNLAKRQVYPLTDTGIQKECAAHSETTIRIPVSRDDRS